MDRSALARRRQRDATTPGRPPTRLPHKRTQSEAAQQPASPGTPTSARIRMDQNGFFEAAKGHRRNDTVPTVGKHSVHDEDNPKHFTVVNVGAGGILYLKPSRVPGPNPNYAPATPPATSEGASSYYSQYDERPLLRESDASAMSGTWTPRLVRRETDKPNLRSAQPPISMQNPHNRKKVRSRSCSTVSEGTRSMRYDANEFNMPRNEDERPRRRRRSSADLSRGELGVSIPHYRLGTPRFSDRGTAYLHASMATMSSVPSSVLSRAEYDKLFPVPPGRGISFIAAASNGQLYLHPSNAEKSMSTVGKKVHMSGRPSTIGIITPSTFDKIESNMDNPAIVHYHPTTGRIVAATPARLIAQITSPDFLDYELLADFFLTFRCFMQCRDLLDYLFARLRWSFTSGNDAGRIVRVRTFVALRHWMLNYFADDFMMDGPFRQDFCTVVNELGAVLRQRPDRGGGDMNILLELKKCWKRTCGLYWHTTDDLETSPHADITPGGVMREHRPEAPSELSLPLSIRPTNARGSIFEMTTIQLPPRSEHPPPMANGNGVSNRDTTSTVRTARIPVSPLSVESIEVLSCSVPFLRHLRPSARAKDRVWPAARPVAAPPKSLNNHKADKPGARPVRHHKRSGSFSDALRDKRTPLSSPKADKIELKELSSFAITGGLVRGLLLQPLAAHVDNYVPVTPGPELAEARNYGGDGNENADRQKHILDVTKFVGEVRRALSNRKGSGSRSRSNSSKGSVGSHSTERHHALNTKPQPDWQQLPGSARLDILGQRIETAYKTAWNETSRTESERDGGQDHMSESDRAETPRPETAHKDKSLPPPPPIPESSRPSFEARDVGRDTHVTNGSRSIVIVDATGAPDLPMISGGMGGTSLSSMSTGMMPIPLFRERGSPALPPGTHSGYASLDPPRTVAGEPQYHWRSSDARMHDLLAAPGRWSLQDHSSAFNSYYPSDSDQARESSGVEGMQPFSNQLRRVPGGNLRDVNHVRSLEMETAPPRPRSEGSIVSRISTANRLSKVQTLPSRMSQDDGGVLLPDSSIEEAVNRTSVTLLATHSSEPILRPSFESEARRLKGLPDEAAELGGIEAALLKLEGKIPSPSMSSSSSRSHGDRSSQSKATETPETRITPDNRVFEAALEESTPPLPNKHAVQEISVEEAKAMYGDIPMKISPSIRNDVQSPATETQGASIFHPSGSGPDYPSGFPLPKQPLQQNYRANTDSNASSSVNPMASRLSRLAISDPYTVASTPESFAYVHSPNSIHTNSMLMPSLPSDRYPSFRPGPWGTSSHPSYLPDDNHSMSDISTELAEGDEIGVRSFFFDDTGNGNPFPVQPYQPGDATPTSTVPTTNDAASPDRKQLLPRHHGYMGQQPGRTLKEKISNPALQLQAANQPFPKRTEEMQRSSPSPGDAPTITTYEKHMPFVLAFESEVIAEQMTIIEKDALDEVDWKDLISLNWQQSPPYVRNWVDFLNKETSNGIDIVIARFNLVVKWCISEIVLTEAPSERARAITKYIHIASNCHRMRNYASLYQITLALLSNEISRLHDTWGLIALREKHMLEQLEQLCRPLRNFHNLRAEMETAMPGNGIIPFIGLYTHDLMFNALKSARIDSPVAGKEPLVNFERYQTAAMIVKNLLRLIEASSRYTFRPEPEALSRCLWIAALEDSEITARSVALEKD